MTWEMRQFYARNAIVAFGGIAIAVCASWLFKLLLFAVARNLFSHVGGADMTLQEWVRLYSRGYALSTVGVVSLATAWHVVALIDTGRHSDRRGFWLILWAGSVLQSIILLQLSPPLGVGGPLWSYLFAAADGLMTFWLATVWCTPVAHKYAPFGSRWRSRLGSAS